MSAILMASQATYLDPVNRHIASFEPFGNKLAAAFGVVHTRLPAQRQPNETDTGDEAKYEPLQRHDSHEWKARDSCHSGQAQAAWTVSVTHAVCNTSRKSNK